MIGRKVSLPPFLRSLSARLLVLTVIFVMVSEVLIFVPSVARFRLNYLQQHIADAHLAMLALEATPDNMVSQELANELLVHVGAHGIVLHKPNNTTLMIDAETPPDVAATYDLRQAGFFGLIRDAMMTLAEKGNYVIRVLDVSPTDPRLVVEVLLDEAPMRREMWGFGIRVLELSIVISLITAALVYLSLQWLLVAPLRRLTASMMRFREDPEDASRVIVPSSRADEIGLAQRELASMQETVRQALRHNARLAALGTAVTKVNHDLRNILSTARLMSDALAGSEAPEVKRVTPALRRSRFALSGLVEEIAEVVEKGDGAMRLVNNVPATMMVEADRDQMFRVILNLSRNAAEAGGDTNVVMIADDGPGLPPKARDNLFRPFAGSARPGGTGLGLAIAREIMRAHGGDIALSASTATGTTFCLMLPHDGGETPQRRAEHPAGAQTARSPAAP